MASDHVKPTGYLGFGSFHSDNVEELVAIPAAVYVSPPLPKGLTDSALLEASSTGDCTSPGTFGRALQSSFFLDPEWTFVNHGAFGAVCKPAMHAAYAWSQYCERQPLRFIDRELFPYVVRALRLVAARVHAPPSNVVFIPNATYGLNVALRSAPLSAGDVIYMLDIGYGSVKKMAAEVAALCGATVCMQSVPMPLASAADMVALVERTMPAGTRLAIFDHITSNTALVLPVADLCRVAKSKGALTLVDGAHGLQSLDLDVSALGCDWYVTNCHKWFCGTKGVAIMCAADSVREVTKPLIISHGFGAGYTSNFIWDGCRDYGGILAIPTVLKWWEALDAAAARTYCQALLQEAVTLLVDAWDTGTHCHRSLYNHMACVELPRASLPPGAWSLEPAVAGDGERGAGTWRPTATSLHAKLVQDALHYGYRVEAPVKCLEGKLYLRISAAIYNCREDFVHLGAVVKEELPAFAWGGTQ